MALCMCVRACVRACMRAVRALMILLQVHLRKPCNPVKGTDGVPAERDRKHGQVDAANSAPPAGAGDPTTSFLTANNFNIRYWSWNYRGCWHQTCPPIDPR